MADALFPAYVEGFVEETQRYLSAFDAKLDLLTENPTNQARVYQIATSDGPVELMVHRTARSLEHPVGEFRCRVHAELKPELAEFVRGKDPYINRYATLGALITDNDRVYVLSQCLIRPDVTTTVAGVLAAAIVHARPSILVSIWRNQELEPKIETLSAWSDIDFEQIQYDYSHLGIGNKSNGRWTMDLQPCGALSLGAVHNNPYWGGGLLCLSWVPENLLRVGDSPIDVRAINKWEHLISDTPMFGGWCRDNVNLVFAQFLPNIMRELPAFTDLLISWARSRLMSIKELVDIVEKFEKADVNKN